MAPLLKLSLCCLALSHGVKLQPRQLSHEREMAELAQRQKVDQLAKAFEASSELIEMQQVWATAAQQKQAALRAAMNDNQKRHDFHAEGEHIKAMRAQLEETKKRVLQQAKSTMEAGLAAEKKTEELEKQRLQKEADRLKEIEFKNRFYSKKEVISAKRLWEEGEISRPASSSEVALQRKPGAAPSFSFPAGAMPKERMNKTYVVDNRLLLAHTRGLGFRFSKKLEDKSEVVAPWGSNVKGADQGDGWVKVGDMYLPTTINNTLVLSFHDTHPTKYEAPETDEDRDAKKNAVERKAKLEALEGKVKVEIQKDLFEFGKGVRHELEKAQHDIAKTLDEASLETQRRNQQAAKRRAAAAAMHREEAEFRHHVREQDAIIAKEAAKRSEQEAAAEQSVKAYDRKWADKIKEEERTFKEEEKATKWAKSHFIKASPGRECPADWSPVLDKTSCKLAMSVLVTKEYTSYVDYNRASESHPAGCYISVLNKHSNFNVVGAKEGALNADDERVCTRDTAASNREIIHQELHVGWAEKEQAKARERRERAAEEAADKAQEQPAQPAFSSALGATGLASGSSTVTTDGDKSVEASAVADASDKDVEAIMTRGLKQISTQATDKAKETQDAMNAEVMARLQAGEQSS